MKLRDDHTFEQRKATLLAIFDDLGDVHMEDAGKRDSPRHLEAEVDAPRAPFVAEARFRYLEWWARDDLGWRLEKYQYDYLDRVRGGRLAYHRHDLAGQPDLLHIHCEPSGRPPTTGHFRSYELGLLEAHEEFAALYASGRAIDCAGLRPLRLSTSTDQPD